MYYTAHYGEVHIIYIPVNLVGNMYICYVYICWSAINGLMELIKKKQHCNIILYLFHYQRSMKLMFGVSSLHAISYIKSINI